MGENLLSLVHIQKLGHPIEEIRQRALASVISKYNLNLVDESNLVNTKLLLENLLDWFDFEKYSEEEKVLNLLLKIVSYKNADLILKEIDKRTVLKRIEEVRKKIGCEYQSIIQDIVKCITGARGVTEEEYYGYLDFPQSGRSELVNGNVPTEIYEFQKDFYSTSSRESKYTEVNTQPAEITKTEEDVKLTFKVDYFPWQHLSPEDKQMLSSVYENLRYIENKNSILEGCRFFTEVILRDFPSEVFIQSPLLVRTFLDLIECSNVKIPVVKCLIKTVESLRKKIKETLNASLFNLKKEFYTTCGLPNIPEGDSENFHLSTVSFSDCVQYDDSDYVDQNVKKCQISAPQFCFEILLQVLPHLGRRNSQEETNLLLSLIHETLSCLISNLNSDIWPHRELRNQFYRIFGKFYEVLKFQKGLNQITYVIVLYFTIKTLNSIKPPSGVELSEILVMGLQSELGSCISDFVLVLLFPQLHSEVYKYVQQLLGQKEKEAIQDHKEVSLILESMKHSIKLLRCHEGMKTKMEKLECFQAALPSLDFHQNFNLVQLFVNSCLLRWRKSQLKDEEARLREKILIKLLAHCNDFVRTCTYREIHYHAEKLLGDEEARTPRYEFPGDKMDFLFRTDVLTEVICHGLSSPIAQVRKHGSDIMSRLLKSKFIMSESCWSDFMTALIPCLGLLQCYADKATSLGRCIVKIFDPDVSRSTGLPPLEVLKGNMRFLFSKSNLMRDEAVSRLFWLLGREDRDNKKLPKMNVLTGLNLSGICCCVKPKEFSKISHSFYSPERLCDVMEILSAEHVEPNLRRSALSQVAVMMDDFHLHPTFLEQNGLERILHILDNCLIEKEYRNYPDSVIPITDILKALAFQNASVRQELSCRIEVMYNILRGLFLFSSDHTLRQDAVELICLLLYNDCVLRVPSDLSGECAVSFPDLVVSRMCLPFSTHVHWKNSRHLEPSVKKTVMGKAHCSRLIRASWAVQWLGSLTEALALQPSDIAERAFSPGIPDDLKISPEDIAHLRDSAFGVSVKQSLYDIQNATTHHAVFSSLHKLQSYLLLYNVDRATFENKASDLGSDTVLSHMLWESTLERFMTSQPSCGEDEALLLEVIRLVQALLRSFNSARLIDWVGKILVDDHQPMMKLLRSVEDKNFGLLGKELRLSIAELTEQTVAMKSSLERRTWFSYLELISELLKVDKETEFYNIAYIDWFLSVLVHLTGNWSWDFSGKEEFLENLIIRVMEIVMTFHCTKDSVVSFLGITIVKNGLLVLNHLTCNAQESVKDWEKLWFQALRKRADYHGESGYYWLLSLWFVRDATTRAAAHSLLLSLTTSSRSCDLLADLLQMPFEHLWCHTFKILFDECECSFVREKAAFLLTNLTNHGASTSGGSFLQYLQKIKFYQGLFKIISNYNSESALPAVRLHDTVNRFSGRAVTTPSFVSSVCVLMTSIMALNPVDVSGNLLKHEILDGLTTLLGEIPDSASVCGEHGKAVDVLQMYVVACRLLTKCVMISCYAHSFLLQSQQCINNLFAMINHSLFCEQSKTMERYKFELWYEILDLFTALLADHPKCEKVINKQSAGFVLLNKCMTDNGIDHFISSVYIAMKCDDLNLRTAAFRFLINLFRLELSTPSHISIRDIFDRKVSDAAVKAEGWKALKTSETLTKNFGVRAADILTQVFLLSTGCTIHGFKTTVADCLGSLLAVCKTAQKFCVERGLQEALVSNLKQICVKLNLEKVENLKKPMTKKKVEPLLWEAEITFRLICNMTVENGRVKSAFADCALSSVVHKLWPWCMAKPALLVVALKMLCTFTHSCDQACRALVGSLNVWGVKKSPGSPTLINAVMNQVSLEMDLVSNSHDARILQLCLQLLTNCCRAAECRSVVSKANFLQCFTKLHPNQKKRSYGDAVVDSWLKFLLAFSSHQEGQLTLTKSQDFLELLTTKSASPKSSHRIDALSILRNVCFYQPNRLRMLSSCSFLSLLFEVLDSDRREEVQAVAVTVWALACNCQKAKLVMRSSGLESKLTDARRRCVLTDDPETAEIIEVVLGILRNK